MTLNQPNKSLRVSNSRWVFAICFALSIFSISCQKSNDSFSLLAEQSTFQQGSSFQARKIDILWVIDNSAFAGASALPLVRAGKLRLLAVAAPQRSPRVPDLPSLAEVAPGFAGTLWFGWYGHAGTPAPIRDAMRGLLQEAMASPQTSAALDRQHGGISPSFTSGPAFDALIERERERFARLSSLLPEQTR